MKECCDSKAEELAQIQDQHKSILWIVLAINLTMFFVEMIYGLLAHSTALLADSLDMLGDSFVYAISLYAIGRSIKWNARISIAKGSIMAIFGLGVIVEAILRYFGETAPIAKTMGVVGMIALCANFICAALLLRHRNDNINMRSTWLCSRNDVIANLGVLFAAFFVAVTGSKTPDLLVGIMIAALVLKSAFSILLESFQELAKKGTG